MGVIIVRVGAVIKPAPFARAVTVAAGRRGVVPRERACGCEFDANSDLKVGELAKEVVSVARA